MPGDILNFVCEREREINRKTDKEREIDGYIDR